MWNHRSNGVLYVDLRFPRKRRLHAPSNYTASVHRRKDQSPCLAAECACHCSSLAARAAVAACGGDDGTDESATALIKQTFSGKKKVDSGKLNLDLSAKLEANGRRGEQLEGPITLKLTGPFQSRGEDKRRRSTST